MSLQGICRKKVNRDRHLTLSRMLNRPFSILQEQLFCICIFKLEIITIWINQMTSKARLQVHFQLSFSFCHQENESWWHPQVHEFYEEQTVIILNIYSVVTGWLWLVIEYRTFNLWVTSFSLTSVSCDWRLLPCDSYQWLMWNVLLVLA